MLEGLLLRHLAPVNGDPLELETRFGNQILAFNENRVEKKINSGSFSEGQRKEGSFTETK